MQDRFKFRGYHPVIGEVMDISEIDYHKRIAYFTDGDGFNIDEVKLMQCTGLRDRHNNLIYEGDIVRFYSLYGHATFEIKWSEEFATFGYEDDETDFYELGRLYDEAAYIEVFGNIYENKELLNEI